MKLRALSVLFLALWTPSAQARPEYGVGVQYHGPGTVFLAVEISGERFGLGYVGGKLACCVRGRVPRELFLLMDDGRRITVPVPEDLRLSARRVENLWVALDAKLEPHVKIELRDRRDSPSAWPAKVLPDMRDEAHLLYVELGRVASKGDLPAVRSLLDAGAPVEWPLDVVGMSPLAWAARWGHSEIVAELLRRPLQFERRTVEDSLVHAAKHGDLATLDLLLEGRWTGDLPARVLNAACQAGDVPMVQRLLDAPGLGLETVLLRAGHRPMHVAALRGHAELFRFLLEAGADTSAPVGDTEGKEFVRRYGRGGVLAILDEREPR